MSLSLISVTPHAASVSADARPRFLQGVFPFAGRGLFEPQLVDAALSYTVPVGHAAQIVYFRAGNHADDLVYITLTADTVPIRYFPIGPKSDCHVALAIVESHAAGVTLEIWVAAPRGLSGTLIVDAGLIETCAGETPEGRP